MSKNDSTKVLVYEFIKNYAKQYDRLPSIQEITEHCFVHRNTVNYHLDALAEEGKIKFVKDGYKKTSGYALTNMHYVFEEDDKTTMAFEKVKYVCFEKDSILNGFQPTNEIYDRIVLPKRQTSGSAGYDFVTPYDIALRPNERVVIPTGIKARLKRGCVLQLHIRSSVGIKKGVVFSNCTGVIDADYYSNKSNDGDIMLALWNTSDRLDVIFKAGERIAQGIIMPYEIVEDDDVDTVRTGGVGSSGK